MLPICVPKAFTLVVSKPILTELVRTLTNPYFGSRLSPADVATALARFHADAVMQPVTDQVSGVATYPQDDVILATALSGRVPYLVTGDKPLLIRGAYQGTRLLSPRQFLELLDHYSEMSRVVTSRFV